MDIQWIRTLLVTLFPLACAVTYVRYGREHKGSSCR